MVVQMSDRAEPPLAQNGFGLGSRTSRRESPVYFVMMGEVHRTRKV
jgi:hypothetical protein